MPFVENQGAKLYWDEQGSGEPLLLIMGLSYPSYMWHRSRTVFANSYRTIALDNRGVGQSDVTPGIYSIALMASDAAAVLHAAGVESAHVFGVSMGGMIALEFALQYPSRVRSLILGCTAAAVPMPCRPNLPRCKLSCAVTSLLKNPRRPSSRSSMTLPPLASASTRIWLSA